MMKKLISIVSVMLILISLAACGTSSEWEISGGVLKAYTGNESEVTVPEDVTELGSDCFSGDCEHGVNLNKVTVPGTVKKIDTGAFAFTNADVIILEEGVTTLEHSVFMDSYIDEIHFPESITECGPGIMETEEGLMGTKIYVKKGSYMDEYFKADMPYGDVQLIYE